MCNLLRANIRRILWCGKAFSFTILLMGCLESAISLFLLKQASTRVDLAMYVSIQGIGIFVSVLLSLFYGTEYSDGTLRNKLIVGHKRSSVYLAGFFCGGLTVSILYILWIGIGLIFAIVMHTPFAFSSQLLLSGVIGWLACISYSAIYNLIGMLSSSKSKSSIISILSAFGLLFGGLLCYSLARPGLFTGTKQLLFQTLFDVNPYGQIFQFMIVDMASLWKLGLYALLLIICLNLFGMYMFQRKDIK
ncbi:ABC transporter permease [[Clostridium] innocuum]|nr:ABC transporter permease [Erysipelotrichaceae bacterium]MCR0382636.1 ABC transporter permease [[Clostridium] innocuum]MCR0413748.1 ABC transporter permease [[Clostridium] innocuum]MCR0534650.1 ABC transporter permease [[Clostridium] innocuum]MCR0538772.1 ABC transporter permease [[Clostridium] innocuum]